MSAGGRAGYPNGETWASGQGGGIGAGYPAR
jgi:hypothetical protein